MRTGSILVQLVIAASFLMLSVGCGGGGGGDSVSEAEKDEECFRQGHSPLVRPPEAVDSDARGRLIHCSRAHGTALRIMAELLDPGIEVEVLMEDAAGALQPLTVAAVLADGEMAVRLVDRVVGVGFEDGALVVIRDAGTSTLLLEGVISSIHQGGRTVEGERSLVNEDRLFAPAGRGKVGMDFIQSLGVSRLGIFVGRVPPGSEIEAFLESPSSGELQRIGSLAVNDSSQGELEFDTELGQALPFQAPFVSDLFGLRVELRSPGGELRFSGVVPSRKL